MTMFKVNICICLFIIVIQSLFSSTEKFGVFIFMPKAGSEPSTSGLRVQSLIDSLTEVERDNHVS